MDKTTKSQLKKMKWYLTIDNDFIKQVFKGKTKSELTKEELYSAMKMFENEQHGIIEEGGEFEKKIESKQNKITEDKDEEIVLNNISVWLHQNITKRSLSEYLEIKSRHIKALLQFSTVPRFFDENGLHTDLILQKDIIIQQITTTPKRCGHGTKFVLKLVNIANHYNMGVQIQSAITNDSNNFGLYLIHKHKFIQKQYNKFDFFSPILSKYKIVNNS